MSDKKIKIFNVPWHIAHQYELYKIPGTEWYHIINNIRRWGVYRPKPENVFDVPYYEPGKYDLAVLHVDQQCVDPQIGKSKLFRQLNTVVKDIPKIIINHATPYWPEVYDEKHMKSQMRILIGDNYMVCNSHEAQKMWGDIGREQHTIIHGMDPDEWDHTLPKEPRVLTTLSSAGLPKYYNRMLLTVVKDKLKERGISHVWIPEDYICQDFDDYRNLVARSLIYFNPTTQSPMPRARTEAMFSGVVPITLNNHDTDMFIENGKNGIFVPNNPDAIVDLIENLMYGGIYDEIIKMGQNARKTAEEKFHINRFTKEWSSLITHVLNEHAK